MIDKNDPKLTAFVLGELDDTERHNIEAAVKSSAELQAAVAEIQSVCGFVEGAYDQELTGCKDDETVELTSRDKGNGALISNPRWTGWAAACSIALLACSIAVTYWRQNVIDSEIAIATKGGIDMLDEVDLEESNVLAIDLESNENVESDVTKAFPANLSMIVSQDTEEPDPAGEAVNQPSYFPPLLREDGRGGRESVQAQGRFHDNGLPGFGGFDENGQGEGSRGESFDVANQRSSSRHEFALSIASEIMVAETDDANGSETGKVSGETHPELGDSTDAGLDLAGQLTHVDVYTFDGSVTTQRASDEDLIEAIIKEPIGRIRPSADAIIPRLIHRVDPSGTQEIDINQQVIDSNISQSEFVDLIQSLADVAHPKFDESSRIRAEETIAYFDFITDEKEKTVERERYIADANKKLREYAKSHNNRIRQRRGWRRVKATGNTSRLIVGDRDELELTGMQVQVQVDGFRARVLLDYFYYNDRDQQLEGNFKMRLPDDASLYYFAFGQSAYDFSPNGPLAQGEFQDGNREYVSLRPAEVGLARQDAWKNVREARMVPREKAAFAYSQTVRRRVDPALVEWSGAGIFNARVFPLMPKQLHRIVIGYDVTLKTTANGLVYRLDLPQQSGECRVDLCVTDFAGGNWELDLEKSQQDGSTQPTTWKSAEAAEGIRSQKRMRFESPDWDSLSLTAKHRVPVLLQNPNAEKGRFFATQFQADLPGGIDSGNEKAIFLVDTSLSSRPEKFNVWLDLMKATLTNNRGELKQFAVLFFDVDCRFWRTKWTDNSQANVAELLKDCYQIGLEGATNLHGAVLELRDARWITDKNVKPDVFLLSDGAANWGEMNLRLIQHDYASLNLGSLFAYQTGLSGTAISGLRYLAGSTGGAVFSVASENEVQTASTAHRKQPWKLESLNASDATDVMTAGRIQWVYPGQMITVVGRGSLDEEGIELKLSRGDTEKTLTVDGFTNLESEMAGRLYGQVSVGQLESLGDSVFDVSAAYARHFRITGETCSLLMLETEADYQRFDIQPKEDWFVVQSKNAAEIVADVLNKAAASLSDPKSQMSNWIERLENMPGMEFEMPTALKLAMEGMEFVAIDSRLDVADVDRDSWLKKYSEGLGAEKLNAELIEAEMERRRSNSVDSALRAYSNLIESNPGDWVATRDVAFTAMDLGRPAAAYHLLRRVVQRRPFEGSTYAALGQCLGQLNKADMAMIYYELALAATFQNQGPDFHKIVATQYRSLLNRVQRGELQSSAREYAVARADSLSRISSIEKSDVVISLMWNTDQTDVDLHVIEPSGEECYYQHKTTKAGGRITADKTDGFGPEMYTIKSAPDGDYKVYAKFFNSDQNRTSVSNKVYLTIYHNFGTADERRTRETITLNKVGEKEWVKTIDWTGK